MRVSGVKEVKTAPRPGSASAAKADVAGFEVMSPANVAKWDDNIMVLTPDEGQRALCYDHLEPNMKEWTALAFAHGLNVHFGLIEPRADIDVFMIAPKGPGYTVRSEYERGAGRPSLLAVHANPTGNCHDIGLGYGAAIGGARAGIIQTTFRKECETVLFDEQAVLCGGLTRLMQAGFDTLVEAGYAPEMAYFECMHELKLIVDPVYEGGIAGMRYAVSNTAEYGDLSTGDRIIDDHVKQNMRELLKDIQSGRFVREWMSECETGELSFKALRRRSSEHGSEEAGAHLRAMMPWLAENKLVDKTKN